MWLTSDHGVIQAEKGNIFEKVYRRKERERERGFTRSDQVLVVGRLYSMIKRI